MSLHDLKSLVSIEDFADAHEPLNDGVKEVPNAQTVTSSTDVGNDTTTAGDAKTIPRKEESDEGTTFTEVKESAETKKSDTTEPSTDNETDSSDATGETLEHETESEAKTELKKTEEATTALENYAPRAKRFDIIGYPRREREQLAKMIGFIARRSDVQLTDAISVESIAHAAEVGRQRMVTLEKQLQIHTRRKVSLEDETPGVAATGAKPLTTTTTTTTTTGQENLEEEIAVTEAPTAHGSPPLDAAVAADITAVETDPLDVPLLEIERVQETIETLTQGAAAIEQYTQILKANPKMSKQAAAVLHAGLEHIDRVCSLKARCTGLESYVTTPRAALEEANVDDRSLSSRASELGAKILKWLKELAEKAKLTWAKYRAGLGTLEGKIEELMKQKFDTSGTVELNPVPGILFMEGEFVGSFVTEEENKLAKALDYYYKGIAGNHTKRVLSQLRDDDASDIVQNIENNKVPSGTFSLLPGNKSIDRVGGHLTLVDVNPNVPDSYTVDLGYANIKKTLSDMLKSIKELDSLTVVDQLKTTTENVSAALIKWRKANGDKISESDFQAVQNAVLDSTVKIFDVERFFEILGQVGKIYSARYKFCASLVAKK